MAHKWGDALGKHLMEEQLRADLGDLVLIVIHEEFSALASAEACYRLREVEFLLQELLRQEFLMDF